MCVFQSSDYEEQKALKNSRYKDRAENRRQTVGSDGTFQRDDAPASVHVYVTYIFTPVKQICTSVDILRNNLKSYQG